MLISDPNIPEIDAGIPTEDSGDEIEIRGKAWIYDLFDCARLVEEEGGDHSYTYKTYLTRKGEAIYEFTVEIDSSEGLMDDEVTLHPVDLAPVQAWRVDAQATR